MPPKTTHPGSDQNKITVINATKQRDLRRFIALPHALYKHDPYWVPPLRLFDFVDYRLKRSDLLRRSQHALLLAYKDGKAAGRMVVYIDPDVTGYFGVEMAYFGAFECVEDVSVSRALYDSCCRWACEHGATVVQGPMDPDSQSWGFVIEGFDRAPVFMSPYSKPYYGDFAVDSGFTKAKDLLAYEGDAESGYTIPDRFRRFSEALLARRPSLSVRRIDPKRLADEAATILELLNEGVAGNWGFVPVRDDEMREIVSKLKLIYDPDAIWFVLDDGKPVGCALGFPDANVLIRQIRGRLLPTGIFSFLLRRRKLRDFRLWGLALLPEYHGQGLDVLLYTHLYKALQPRGIRLEASYILEDNYRMRNAVEKLGLYTVKKYRVYDKTVGNESTVGT